MLTDLRWQKERELMQSVFPQFKPFVRRPAFGFEGWLKGSKSGRVYRVVLEGDEATYPQSPPDVRMEPNVGHHWLGQERRRLCVYGKWRAATSTFANMLLAAVKYLEEHDGQPILVR